MSCSRKSVWTASECGTVDAQSRERQAIFQWYAYDDREHADVNAAQNILRRSTALMRMEDLHEQSYEVRTKERLAPLKSPGFSRKKMLRKTFYPQQKILFRISVRPELKLPQSYFLLSDKLLLRDGG